MLIILAPLYLIANPRKASKYQLISFTKFKSTKSIQNIFQFINCTAIDVLKYPAFSFSKESTFPKLVFDLKKDNAPEIKVLIHSCLAILNSANNWFWKWLNGTIFIALKNSGQNCSLQPAVGAKRSNSQYFKLNYRQTGGPRFESHSSHGTF